VLKVKPTAEQLQRIAAMKGVPETELANPECVKYLTMCLKGENQEPAPFDDRAEVNDNNTYYADEG